MTGDLFSLSLLAIVIVLIVMLEVRAEKAEKERDDLKIELLRAVGKYNGRKRPNV